MTAFTFFWISAIFAFCYGFEDRSLMNASCLPDEFACADGATCIPLSWKCDLTPDCIDESDEPPDCSAMQTCHSFTCHKSGRCIPLGRVCDGQNDCGDADDSDESIEACPRRNQCPPNHFRCDDGITCDYLSNLCNTNSHCPDGSGIGEFCSKSENCSSLNCSHGCQPTRNGPVCFCQHGMQPDGTQCVDFNECNWDGYCDQMCTNLNGSFTCDCVTGYKLVNKTRCIATNEPKSAPPLIVYGSRSRLEILYLNGSQALGTSLVEISDLLSMDCNHQNNSVCWINATTTESDFTCAKVNNLNNPWTFKPPPEYSLTNAHYMAYDWISGNWYILDSRQEIFLCNSDISICLTLVGDLQNKPRGIVLDPLKGLMFISSWGTGKAKIERAFMDGEERISIVDTMIGYPIGLTIDFPNANIYWVDSYYSTIERVDYNGNTRRTIARMSTGERPYGITLFENFLYITSWRNMTIKKISKQQFVKPDEIVLLKPDLPDPLFIHVLHKQRQPTVEHPCATNNGGCQHLCVPLWKNDTAYPKCLCQPGYTLNGTTSCVEQQDCGENMFRCGAMCISAFWLCDGDTDCTDGSDESTENCKCNNPGQFECMSGRCISKSWVCDHHFDCGPDDHSDELDCDRKECDKESYFMCGDGSCIPIDYVCDTDEDCSDGTDELFCDDFCNSAFTSTGQISPYCLLACKNNTNSSLCEELTGCFVCPSDNGGTCIAEINICDNHIDCPDGSDEQDCIDRVGFICKEDEFRCKTFEECIPNSMRCDGNSECPDGSDEEGCDIVNCSNNDWKCDSGNQCIFELWQCDGEEDCNDGSDEQNCPEILQPCLSPSISCDNNTKCVPLESICNSIQDCTDGLDEGGLCNMEDCSGKGCSYSCTQEPQGPVCTCPVGQILQDDGITCSEAHPCKRWGACSQSCFPFKNFYKCSCFSGYQLEPDAFTCKSTEPGIPYLLFSNRHELRRINMYSSPSSNKALISKLKNTIALDFYHSEEGNFVFWTDIVDDKIYKGSLTDGVLTNIVVVLQTGLATAEGLSVDWVGQNLYWVESNLNQIEVAKLNGLYRRTLIASNMDSPRAIVLDPGVGLLFWTDWEENNARIESASMSGEGRNIVVNVSSIDGGGWPNGLTLDFILQRIYWVDAKSDSIHCAKYDGSDVREILRNHVQLSHPFAISLYENKVYWTDWRTNSVCSANKFNGSDIKILQRTITQPFDLKILHSSRQPKRVDNPCGVNNGGCSHLCLLSFNSSYQCNCPHIMSLGNDSHTCIKKEKVLLFSRENEIRGVDLARTSFDIIPRISASKMSEPRQIAFLSSRGFIYWIDSMHSEVHRVNLSGEQKEIVVDRAIESPAGFAIDWLSNNMFIGSSGKGLNQISVATLNGEFLMPLNLGKINQLESLAIDPYEGKIFWSDVFSTNHKIEMASMLGHEREILTSQDTNEDLLFPTSLMYDHDTKRLYWLNKDKLNIQYYSFETKEVFILIKESPTIKPKAMTVYQDYVYFSNEADHSISRVSKFNGSHTEQVLGNVNGVLSLLIYDDNIQEGSNVCTQDADKCSHLCLPVNATAKKCLCAVGFRIDSDNPNLCVGQDGVLIYSTNIGLNGISIKVESKSTEEKLLPPISQVGVASRLDFHAKKDLLIWVDDDLGMITKIQRAGTQRQVLFDDAELIDGLAVDWIADNIYWSNPHAHVIEMCRLNASERYIIIAEGLTQPGALAVFPSLGYLFWVDNGSPARIERSALDGSNRHLILNESLQHITDISIDYEEQILYFIDQVSKKLERVGFDGSNRFELPIHDLEIPVSLFVYLDSIFVADMSAFGGSIREINKTSMSVRTLQENVGTSIKSIIVMSNETQKGRNPCHNNGGCQEICLFNGVTPNCHCYHGKISPNGMNCTDYTAFLMYSSITSIESLHMFDEKNPNLPLKAITSEYMKNAISLTYDFLQKRLYYSDIQHGSINSVLFNGTGHKILVERQGFVEGIAFDEVERKLYWTCKSDASINHLNIDPPGDSVQRIVKLQSDDKPRGIALNGCTRQIYWTNWNTKSPSIQRSFTDGSKVEYIITNKIRMPNGLTIDHAFQKLYWGDARLDKIERCNLDGSDRVVLLNEYPNHPFDLAIYGDYIFWTDWGLNSVVRANKYTGKDIVKIKTGISRLMGIVAIANDTNICPSCGVANGGCEDICTLDHEDKVTCHCFPGRSLQDDGKHCSSFFACRDDEFLCKSGYCIPYIFSCDGVIECPDASDEDHNYCNDRKCREGYFNCGNGFCIHESNMCDRIPNCPNFKDEQNCTCNEQEFKCDDTGHCLPLELKCNHEPDCPNASDEMGCPKTDCSTLLVSLSEDLELINCVNTTNCIHKNWLCDGANDCWDNSDEQNCPTVTPSKCPNNTHQCNDGNCISLGFKCDGEDDCKDGNASRNSSDEEDCPFVCPKDQIKCDSDNTCIYKYWFCDGKEDCPSGSDEPKDCSLTCNENEYKCKSSGRCIPLAWKCDGHNDCEDDEDPLDGCPSSGFNLTTYCNENDFLCALFEPNEYRCIPKNFVCDGSKDCVDGADESEELCFSINCTDTQFTCSNNECIPLVFMCNGKPDCLDGSDEENCVTNHTQTVEFEGCSSDKFTCGNDICLDHAKVCNGENDCGDWSDEGNCAIFEFNECENSKNFTLCEHECQDLLMGYKCACHDGYRLNATDNSSCVDINECEEEFPCSHYCYNTIGSYKCECAPGFFAEDHGRKCKHEQRPNLIISIRFFIQEIDSHGSVNHTTLVGNLTNVVALDYDYSTGCIYWSDVTHLSAHIKGICKGGSPKIIHSTVQSPDGIAVDWVAKNLYWCDKGKDTIEVSSIDGVYRKVLIDNGLEDPRAIILDPFNGYMYWTDWGNHPHIGKAGMDGSDQEIIINSNLRWPNALTISYVTKELFWADASFEYVGRADLDGKNRRIVLRKESAPNYVQHIFAISVFEEWLYWTDWESKSVIKAHKYTGKNAQKIYTSTHRPMDIHVYHPLRQPPLENNPCENGGGCGTLCLLAPGGERTCACPDNYILQANQTCIPNCSASQFVCNSTYKCIPFFWKCDTVNDCGDHSDEPDECPTFTCYPGQFQCNNGTCIHPSQICDGINNCNDNSDEQNCDEYVCMQSFFKCPPSNGKSGFCIEKRFQCDGTPHCPGGEDEKSCIPHSCPSDSFQCNNTQCIPVVWVCDDDKDCPDGSDEMDDCAVRKCFDTEFKCKNGRCIPNSWKCDGQYDCLDKEDESGCESILECQNPSLFRCKSNKCIPNQWKCDGDDDCNDGSDEDGCKPRHCTEGEFVCDGFRCLKESERCDGVINCDDQTDEMNCTLTCKENEFLCTANHTCILKEWRCDSEADCADGSDERDCKESCPVNQSKCKSTNDCIPDSWLCDGYVDCTDSSDEEKSFCLTHSCLPHLFRCNNSICLPQNKLCNGIDDCKDNSDESSNLCKQHCRPNEFKCKNGHCIGNASICDGYNDCLDNSDESDCPSGPCRFGLCSQTCTPKKNGTHGCSCIPGYRLYSWLTMKRKSCFADGDPAYMIVANDNHLRQLFPNKHGNTVNIQVITDERAENIRLESIDVLFTDSNPILYWTNRHDGTIAALPMTVIDDFERSDSRKDPNKKQINILMRGLKEPRGISVDWATKIIYFVDSLDRTVCAMAHDGSKKVTLFGTLHDEPFDIVVDPFSAQFYVSIWGLNPRIEVAKMNGSNRRSFVDAMLAWPTGLAIDFPSNRLYWVDSKMQTVETVKLDGTDRQTLKDFIHGNEKPRRLDVFEDFLYVTTSNTNAVYRMSKFIEQSDSRMKISQYLVKISDLVLIQKQKQSSDVINPCLNNSCHSSSLCLMSGFNSYTCHCPDNLQQLYAADGQLTCIERSTPVKECTACIMGTCVLSESGPRCRCHPMYKGPKCNIYRCSGFCKNNGRCMADHSKENPGGEPALRCICSPMYTGKRCETRHRECLSNELFCLNGGKCVEALPGYPEYKQCICNSPFTGLKCEQCESLTCKNGGICGIDAPRSTTPSCSCPRYYKGTTCEISTCDQHCNGQCVRVNGTLTCQCSAGWSGDDCDICTSGCEDPCENLSCYNGGECKASWNPKPSATCICPPNFSGDKCQSSKCDGLCENGLCEVHEGLPTCKCDGGWTGHKCSQNICKEPNVECWPCNSLSCMNGGLCLNNSRNNKEFCHCESGFHGPFCELAVCDGFCQNGGSCLLKNGRPTCVCLPGFIGERCRQDECTSIPCIHGQCRVSGNTATCLCEEGYTGKHCDTGIEMLPCNFRKCENGGICWNIRGEAICSCTPSFDGHHCQYPTDPNHNPCNHFHCYSGGICRSRQGEVDCVCRDGWVGPKCEERSNCTNDPCLNGGTCAPNIRGDSPSTCHCQDGFVGARCETSTVTDFYENKYGSTKVTAIVISICIILLLGIIILGIYRWRTRIKRRHNLHSRLKENGSAVELSNPVYLNPIEHDQDNDAVFTLHNNSSESNNFKNPIYDIIYEGENSSSQEEKASLLESDPLGALDAPQSSPSKFPSNNHTKPQS